MTATRMSTTVRFTDEEISLLDDVVSYYTSAYPLDELSGFDRAALKSLTKKVAAGHRRLEGTATAPKGPTELRMGRNFVRVGDIIKVKPSKPRRRDGFTSKLRSFGTKDGVITAFCCAGPNRESRTLPIARLQRVNQTLAAQRSA